MNLRSHPSLPASMLLAACATLSTPALADLGPAPRLPPDVVPQETPGPVRLQATTSTAAVSVDPMDRFAVSLLYRNVYAPEASFVIDAPNVSFPPDACDDGSTPAEDQAATLERVNVFRALAGLPGDVSDFGGTYQSDDQAAALVQATNTPLSHAPPSTYTCWTPAGYNGSYRSNLTLGMSGSTTWVYVGINAVEGYMDDPGAGNADVGHRRWLLYPPQAQMASGDAIADYSTPDVSAYSVSNALWVTGAGSNYTFGVRPATPDGTAWPPRGYVPWQLLPKRSNRWSFSYPDASFCGASVTMTRDGAPVGLNIVDTGTLVGQCPPNPNAGFAGDPTIVWEPASGAVDYTQPTQDTVYAITISGIAGAGAPASVSYTVTVIDPADAIFADSFDRTP